MSELFRVTVTYETVILAKSSDEAVRQVKYGMGEIDDYPTIAEARLIKTREELPPGWYDNCLPWGERCPYDRNIGQILAAKNGEGVTA